MKRTILFVVTAFIAFGAVFRAEAKKPEDQEFRRVIVTLKSGEKVEGYLKSGWHADGALLKKENYSFKITKTPDDKESVKYTADEVTCIDYAEKTEENPDGIHWDALDIASPSIGNRYNTIRRLDLSGQSREERYDLLVEDLDNGTGGQYQPPDIENRSRRPVPRRSR